MKLQGPQSVIWQLRGQLLSINFIERLTLSTAIELHWLEFSPLFSLPMAQGKQAKSD